MIESDVEPVFEIGARFVLLAIFCISIAIWLDLTSALYWLAVYVLTEAANIGFLATRRRPGTHLDTQIASGLIFITTLWFSILPIYLWSLDITLMRFAALSLVVGMVLYSITRYSGLRRIAIWDGILISGLTLYFGYDMARQADTTTTMLLTMLFSVLMVLYYLVSLYESVATRSALKLAEKRNIQAQKMEAVGQLTGGIAHDFNNLLTVMIGNLDLYSEVEDREEKDVLAEEARQAALRAATLTAHLLAFSRKARLNPKTFDPERFLQSFVALTSRVLPDSISLQLELTSAPHRITADVNQLENALLNLVINARDAMSDFGTIILRLDWVDAGHEQEFYGTTLPAGRYCRISVVDSGPGIAPELQMTVMDPFFTTKPVGKGSGLGLPMAKGFVEQSGGALELVSQPGDGTNIAFWLPVSGASQPQDNRAK
jgi:two-component system, cell cycle sensor histidine kinase and response regulator CckA